LPEQPFVGEHAVYLIALEKRIPDEILPLDQIRDRVAADYRYRQAVLIAGAAARILSTRRPTVWRTAGRLARSAPRPK